MAKQRKETDDGDLAWSILVDSRHRVPDEYVERRAEHEVGSALFCRLLNSGKTVVDLRSKVERDLYSGPGTMRHDYRAMLTPVTIQRLTMVECDEVDMRRVWSKPKKKFREPKQLIPLCKRLPVLVEDPDPNQQCEYWLAFVRDRLPWIYGASKSLVAALARDAKKSVGKFAKGDWREVSSQIRERVAHLRTH